MGIVNERDAEKSTGTSLVPVTPLREEERKFGYSRSLATFVTQLVARTQNVPHLRDRRRANPADAAKAYLRMMNLGAVPNRHARQVTGGT